MTRAPRTTLAATLLLLAACASLPQAAFRGDVSRVADHLAGGKAAVDERFHEGECVRCTLLHYAAGGGRIEVARLLLDKGAEVNLADGSGRTALHHACANQEMEAAGFLLANGAKPSLATRDAWGNTPLLLAVASRKERDSWVFTPFGAVATTVKAPGPSVPLVELLLAEGADIGATTSKGNSALHLAAYLGHPDVVRVLLAHGADRQARNADGATPAVLAAQFGKTEVVTVLQEPATR
jgi:ankyrin repeat protein